ncbi:E3 binding domain-containing protein [Vreelandella sp. EE27]
MNNDTTKATGDRVHATPTVRMLARTLGVDLAEVAPSGPKERVVKEDVNAFVRQVMSERRGKAE